VLWGGRRKITLASQLVLTEPEDVVLVWRRDNDKDAAHDYL